VAKIVLIGAGSGFGAETIRNILSFEELRDSEIVLVDINTNHLDPIAAYARKVVDHYKCPAKVSTALNWRDGVLDAADYVITSFSQGGPAYNGIPFHYEMSIPREYGIHQNIADTAGMGGVFRMMRTAPEMLAIGKDMEERCPGSYMLNYVNPMAMLTRIMNLACPKINVLGLCHNIQYGIRGLGMWLDRPHKELRFLAAGVNHMVWFLRLEYLDGRDAYPDLVRAIEKRQDNKWFPPVQYRLLKDLGYWTTESSEHCAEYLPYFMAREEERNALGLKPFQPSADFDETAARWTPESDVMQQLAGKKPLSLERGFEYGIYIIHSLETGTPHRMHLNVLNRGMIENLPDGYCVEVPCTVGRTGVGPHHVGRLPIHLAALCRGLGDMQTLASDAFLEKDLTKAYLACVIDPCTAASATPARIKECFNKLLEVERKWLEPYWGRKPSL